MAIATLAEGNKYSTTTLQGYVIDRLSKMSEVLMHLTFEELPGNSLTYDTITTRSGVEFHNVGATWTEDTLKLSQATVVLKILGGDADVDNFLLATRSNQLDLQGIALDDKVLAMKEKFIDTYYYGDASSNSEEFSGLQVLMTDTAYNTVHAGSSTGTALSIAKLQEAIDLTQQTGWMPQHMFMSYAMRRGIQTYLDTIGDKFTSVRDEFGNMIEYFRGLKVVPDQHIVNTETAASGAYTAKTTGSNTTIFIPTFAPKGVSGVQGSSGVEVVPIGDLETKDAQRWRVKWYVGVKFEDIRSAAKVDGIVAASSVTA